MRKKNKNNPESLREQLRRAKKEVERIEDELQIESFNQLVPILREHATLEVMSTYTGIVRVVCPEPIMEKLKKLIQDACISSFDVDRIKITSRLFLQIDSTHPVIVYVNTSGKTADIFDILSEELNKLQLKVSFQPVLDSINRDIRLKLKQEEQVNALIAKFQ